MDSSKLLRLLSLVGALFTLCVMGLGAFTRLMDAGLGCPDWPGCYGQVVVPSSVNGKHILLTYPGSPLIIFKAWAEMIHRYFAGTLSMLVLFFVSVIAYRKIKFKDSYLVKPALFIIVIIIYQIMLGRWTVTLQLLPIIVSQHLLGGMLILSTLFYAYFRLITRHLPQPSIIEAKFAKWANFGFILLFMQIFLGAWTSTNYASMSCPDFPFCHNMGELFPAYFQKAFNFFSPIGINYEGGVLSEVVRQTIQMTHRLGALVVTLYLFVLNALLLVKCENSLWIKRVCHIAIVLLLLQVTLGIINVLFHLPVISAVAHNIVAALLLQSIVAINVLLLRRNSCTV